jgi:nucleotide-binding universal stress UspA family protein
MYGKILIALDGSLYSDFAIDIALRFAKGFNLDKLYGCHIYASTMHRTRFMEMEPGLPERYQTEDKIHYLRNTHEDLITDGMQLISDAYLAPLVKKAEPYNINIEGIAPEGRNYAKLIETINKIQPDLVIMGAWGHGKENNHLLGSNTQKLLMHSLNSDLLIVKKPMIFKYNPIVVGIDGSTNSYHALKKGLKIADVYKASIDAIAVYDPYFHTGVFRTIADVLPTEQQKKFNFTAQEKIHDEIIDKGLENLYLESLQKAQIIADSNNKSLYIEVLKGKVYTKLTEYCHLKNSDLLVLGRWGLHKEDISLIGSHAFNAAFSCNCNILIVYPSKKKINIPQLKKQETISIQWTPEAENLIKNIPPFARNMAKKMIEDHAREQGFTEIVPELVDEIAKKFGMKS